MTIEIPKESILENLIESHNNNSLEILMIDFYMNTVIDIVNDLSVWELIKYIDSSDCIFYRRES